MAPPESSQQAGNPSSLPDHLFRVVVDEIAPSAIFLMDLQGRVTFWNRGAERLLGYTPEEVLGTSFARFFTKEDIANGRPERELREAATTGNAADDNWMVRKDGSRIWVHGVTRALWDENGQLEAFVKVVTDLTEQRRADEERFELLAREQAAEVRAKAEEGQRKAEERFRLLVASVTDYAIFLLDPNGQVISWNAGAEQVYGYRDHEVIGKNVDILSPPEECVMGGMAHRLVVAQAEGRDESEGFRLRKDGSLFWAHNVITALHNDEGKLIGFATVTRDLTAQKRAEIDRALLIREQAAREAAEESERRISTILNSITDAFSAVDHQFRITYLNDRARQMVQALVHRPGADLIGMSIWDAGPQLFGNRFETKFRRVIAEEVPAHFEEYFPPFAIWLDVHAYPADGGIAIYFRDVTERKRLEEERTALIHALDAERNWLREVIAYSPVGILLVEGAEGERVVANRKAEELFGHPLPAEGGITQYVGQVYLPNGTPLPHSQLATTRALQGETIVGEEQLLYQPTGREVRVRVSAVPMWEHGTIVGAVVVYEDVTQIRELERRREEWTSVVTHDLRNPITVIIGYVSILDRHLRPQLTPKDRKSLENVLVAARNLNKMIGDLLEVSRLEARRLTLKRQMVNVGELVRDIVSRMTAATPAHPIRLEMHGDIPATCIDPARIEQVISNLLSNAAKYSYPHSEIQVFVERHADEVMIAVTNHGPGILPEEIPKLFSRFFRTKSAQAGEVSGLGLGLYISKGLVEAHRGRMGVASVPEKTTTFHFTIPLVASCPEEG